MSTSFAGFTLVTPLEPDAGLERFWARRTSAPAWPARLTRTTGALGAPARAALLETWTAATFLEHPALVRAISAGQEGDAAWVAHEVVDGVTLRAMLSTLAASGHLLPADVLLELAGRVCEALAYVHAAAGPDGRQLMLTHNGLCPENVWLTREGTVKLDGLRHPSDPRPVGADPAYRAPEVTAGERPDPRSDLYALGVLCAEMMAGHRPDMSSPDALAAALSQRTDVPAPLPGLVAELCTSNRDARPQLARMLTQRLDNLRNLVAEPVGLTPYVTGGVAHLSPPSLANPATALLAEIRSAGIAYPPSTSRDLVVTGIAPSGHDALSALSEPAPEPAAPRLTLPQPSEAPAPMPPPEPALPRLLDVSDVPPAVASTPKSWTAGGEIAGMPAWLMIAMGVLSVVGAVALARLLFVGEDVDRRAKLDAPPTIAKLAKPNLGLPPLEVTSNPPGAAIFIDDKRIDGVTPYEPRDLKAGTTVEVFVALPGYADAGRKKVTLDGYGREMRTVHFNLRALRRFRIETDPPGATVRIEGRQAPQTTPFWLESVAQGEQVNLEVSKRGFLPVTESFSGGAKTATVTRLKLEPARLFDIDSEPRGATVRVDGEVIGKTPIEEYAVPLGRQFEVEISRPDCKPYKTTLKAKGKLVQKVKARLRTLPFHKLPLTPAERGAYEQLSSELRQAGSKLKDAKRRIRAAKSKVRAFETAATISVTELEEAQLAVEEAEADLTANQSFYDTKKLAFDELRTEVVDRLEMAE